MTVIYRTTFNNRITLEIKPFNLMSLIMSDIGSKDRKLQIVLSFR